MDYRQAFKSLSEDLSQRGYVCRLDSNHTHPRMYVGCCGEERFAILSSTANYNTGGLMDMKRRDIERDVLAKLPKPIITPEITSRSNAAVPETSATSIPVDDQVWPVKAYIAGRGRSFVVTVPKALLPAAPEKTCAAIFLTVTGKQLGIILKTVGEAGSQDLPTASPSRSDDRVAFHFARDKVPFTFAQDSLGSGYKAPALVARRRGEAIVTDKPLPEEVLTGGGSTILAAGSRDGKHTIEDGRTLILMLNEWLSWAKKTGHDPEISVDETKCRIDVAVIERVKRKL